MSEINLKRAFHKPSSVRFRVRRMGNRVHYKTGGVSYLKPGRVRCVPDASKAPNLEQPHCPHQPASMPLQARKNSHRLVAKQSKTHTSRTMSRNGTEWASSHSLHRISIRQRCKSWLTEWESLGARSWEHPLSETSSSASSAISVTLDLLRRKRKVTALM